MVHVSAKEALVDPYITIKHEEAMPKRDPGYASIDWQNSRSLDKRKRVITDYTGRPIIKIDQDGGIFDNQLPKQDILDLSPRDKFELKRAAARLLMDEDGTT